ALCDTATTTCVSYCYGHLPDLHSFATRLSSDLRSDTLAAPSLAAPQPQIEALGVGFRRTDHGVHGRSKLQPAMGERSFAEDVKRSEEHTSELQSRFDLVCRLLLEKKKHGNTPMPWQPYRIDVRWGRRTSRNSWCCPSPRHARATLSRWPYGSLSDTLVPRCSARPPRMTQQRSLDPASRHHNVGRQAHRPADQRNSLSAYPPHRCRLLGSSCFAAGSSFTLDPFFF